MTQEVAANLDSLELYAHCVFGDEVPKNSLESFKRAAKTKMNGIETDVFLTKDKVPIIAHAESQTGHVFIKPKGSDEDYKLHFLGDLTAEELRGYVY